MVPALMVRATAIALVEIGLWLAIVSLIRERLAVRRSARFADRMTRREPAFVAVGLVVLAVIAVHWLGAISDWHTNPYDDDIAYLAFVKKLSDTGTLLEPFSFRRISAYGGQTFFLELLSVRAAPSQAFTWDRGVCVWLITLLMIGHRQRGRRASLLFVGASLLILVVMPNAAINTASYFSGVVFFLGLFRTLVWVEERNLVFWRAALPIALVSAAVCTLRQNYIVIPVVVLGVSYLADFVRTETSFRKRLAEPLATAGFSLLFLLPWFIVSWQSHLTFLYPVMPGTFHQALALNASAWNFVREIAFQSNVAVDGPPLQPFVLFFVAAALVGDRGVRMPLTAICVGSIVGFVALVHGLTQSDTLNIGRYAFAFFVAMALAVVLTTGTTKTSTNASHRSMIAGGIVLFAILYQIVVSRETLWKEYGLKFHNIELLAYAFERVAETHPPEQYLYEEKLQRIIPQGERIAVVVDEPYYLDFRRNPIWNLDMPGYASLPPGLPSFKGSEALENYFKTLGLRWLMFVKPEFSRYHYRRSYWVGMLVDDQEIWRTYAPYLVDFIDNMTEIRKRHREACTERGIVIIDLAEPPAVEASPRKEDP
jgi:hypothetical protein